MTNPKVGYKAGAYRLVAGNVDSDGDFSVTNTSKEGYVPGIYKLTEVTVDGDGDLSVSSEDIGISNSVAVTVDAEGDLSTQVTPQQGFVPGIYRVTTSTNYPKDGLIDGFTAVIGSQGYQYNTSQKINAASNVGVNTSSIDWTVGWVQNEISGATNTESGSTNEYNVAASNGAGGRAIKTKEGLSIESGKHYLVMCTVDQATNLDGGDDGKQYALNEVTTSAGAKFVNLPSGASGIYGYRWTSSSTTSIGKLRFGIGCLDAASADRSVRITKPVFYEIPNLTDDFPVWNAVDKVYDSFTGYNFSSGNSGEIVATGNIVTASPVLHNAHSFGFGTGDSFANDTGDWPGQLANINGLYSGVFYGKGYSGQGLTGDIGDNFQTNLDAYDYDWCVIQGGVNDINTGESVADMKTAVIAMCDYAVAKGVKVRVCTMSPWGNYSGWSSGEQTLTDEYNTWVISTLPGLYSGYAWVSVKAVDIYTALEGDSNSDDLSNTGNGDTNDYDSGDGLHPNQTGAIAIANTILATL